MFRLYARVLGLLGPQMRLGWLLALANVALAAAALAEPVLFGRIIDALAGAQGKVGALDWPRLTLLVAAWVGAAVGGVLAWARTDRVRVIRNGLYIAVGWVADSRRAELPPQLAGRPGTPFVGRRSELEAVCQAWERIADGGRALVLVSGDRGMGVSRLLAEAAELHDWLEEARHMDLDDAPRLTAAEAEELVAEIRVDRDAR